VQDDIEVIGLEKLFNSLLINKVEFATSKAAIVEDIGIMASEDPVAVDKAAIVKTILMGLGAPMVSPFGPGINYNSSGRSFGGRGWKTTVAADLDQPVGESSCISCGACVQACPTGAIRRLPLEEKAKVKIGLAMIDKGGASPMPMRRPALSARRSAPRRRRRSGPAAGCGPGSGSAGCAGRPCGRRALSAIAFATALAT
jgi:ferredoxin